MITKIQNRDLAFLPFLLFYKEIFPCIQAKHSLLTPYPLLQQVNEKIVRISIYISIICKTTIISIFKVLRCFTIITRRLEKALEKALGCSRRVSLFVSLAVAFFHFNFFAALKITGSSRKPSGKML